MQSHSCEAPGLQSSEPGRAGPGKNVPSEPDIFWPMQPELTQFFTSVLKDWVIHSSDLQYCFSCGKDICGGDEEYWFKKLKKDFGGKNGLSRWIEEWFLPIWGSPAYAYRLKLI
jgi:hypothetical protein